MRVHLCEDMTSGFSTCSLAQVGCPGKQVYHLQPCSTSVLGLPASGSQCLCGPQNVLPSNKGQCGSKRRHAGEQPQAKGSMMHVALTAEQRYPQRFHMCCSQSAPDTACNLHFLHVSYLCFLGKGEHDHSKENGTW